MEPIFSICIPNYNYGDYLGMTIDSVINQKNIDSCEILISDNSSTDNSKYIIQSYLEKYPFINAKFNKYNVGFAGNLEEVSRMAMAPWMILLSSDDLISNDALSDYTNFIKLVSENECFAFSSTFEKIDSFGNFLSFIGPKSISVWTEEDVDSILTKEMGFKVYKVKSSVMLKRCLEKFSNPFNFASTCYPRMAYDLVGGYSGGRIYNPDKWFHWKLLTVTDNVYFLDKPLFKYRWHNNNQASIESQTGELKYWIDEYRNSFECTPEIFKKAGLDKKQFVKFFCIHISKHILQSIAEGKAFQSERLYHFAKACYPVEFSKSRYFFIIRLSLMNKVLFKNLIRCYTKMFK